MSQDYSVVANGVLLPELTPITKGYSLQVLFKKFIESSISSRGAKDLLMASNPSRCITDGSNKQLIAVEGSSLGKDPHTEAIRRFSRDESWSKPSVEDSLRLFDAICSQQFNRAPTFNPGQMKAVIVMHEPVKGMLLGITFERSRIILSAHKAEPREGWFCRLNEKSGQLGFAFRLT